MSNPALLPPLPGSAANERHALISVVIPARNAAATLAETLASLAAQSFTDWEAFVVDDGSTDDTAAIIASHAARDPRFHHLTGPGEGVSAARNLGIAAARGRWLHFLDADDWNDPTFYAKLLAALAEAPDAVAAFCGLQRVMPGGAVTRDHRMPAGAEDPFEDFARGCLVAIHAVLVDRETILQVGGFDTTLRNCEDWDLWQRVSRLGRRWVLVDQPMAYYRTQGPSLSRNVEWLLDNSRAIIARGFSTDERLAGLAVKHAAGGSAARGSIAQALAYNALWTLGMDCGAAGPGRVDAGMLRPFADAAFTEAHAIATVICEGLVVGLRCLPEQLAAHWPEYGDRLSGLIAWLGEVWGDAATARAIQYHLEERVLYSEPFTEPRRLRLTQSVQVDLARPPHVALPPGVDRFYACVTREGRIVTHVSVAALGDFTPREWLRTRGYASDFGYRGWRKAYGLAADFAFLREAARLFWREPGLLRGRAQLRAGLGRAAAAARLALLGPLDPPGSHAGRLREVSAWAADQAARNGGADAVAAAAELDEPAVDAEDRQRHFESLFETEDPWNYGSAYEQEKYQRQLAILPEGRIERALELACAEGHFTAQLAPRVDFLLATDISTIALQRTQRRCAGLTHVEYRQLDFSAAPIPPDNDLIICSEVLYYLADEAELRRVAPRLAAALRAGGCLVTAHAHVVQDDRTRTGFDWGIGFGADTINRVFSELPELRLERSIETELYRIDRFRRLPRPEAPPVIETLPVAETLDRRVARAVIWDGAVTLRDEAAREQRIQVPVLMYHSIADDGPPALARFRTSPAMFRAQLRWLRSHGYYGIGSEELAAQMAKGYAFQGRPVLITFDDGFQDFADTAWPLLAAHDFIAEVFVVTGAVGQTAIWDEAAGPPGRLMDAATIARLAAEGVRFGSHLAAHRPVDGLASLELAQGLAGSRAMLARWLGKPPVSFAAPYTVTDSRLGGLANSVGYQIGFGGRTGAAALGMDPLDLPRIEIEGGWTLAQFSACLERWR